jgi:hypothetical protein
LSETPQLERVGPFAGASGYRAYHVRGTNIEGFVIPSEVQQTFVIPGQQVLLVPFESSGTGGMFATLVWAYERGTWHYAGYIASPNGHLRLRPEGRYLQALTPVYKSSDANCCPSARRLTRYTLRDTKVVAVDSVAIPRGLDLPAWLYLVPGTRAFLGTDGQDAPVASVCGSVMAVDKRTFGRCPDRAMGTPIVIEGLADGGYPCDHSTQVHVRAADGSWSGYVSVDAVEPAVPHGTLLKVERFAEDPQPFGTRRSVDKDPGIASDATVRVDGFDPKAPDRVRDTRVTVTSGAHVGKNGWVLLYDTILDDVPVPPVMVCPNDLRWLTLR